MKILYVIDTLNTGGTEKSLLHITSRFKEAEPVFVCLFNEEHDLLTDFHTAKVRVIQLGLRRGDKFWLPKAVRRLSRIIAELQPAVIHAHLYNGELAARLAVKKNKQILVGAFVNDSYVKERIMHESLFRRMKIRCYQWLDSITAKRCDAFTSVTNSIAVSNAKALGLPLQKIQVIYRGRPVNSYRVNHPSLSTDFNFLCVGRLLKRKGYLELIEAAKMLKEKGRTFRILCAGAGVDAAMIQHAAEKANVKDRVIFLGNASNVPQLLSEAHAFILPSHYEGMGASIVEAMLAAKPIIASDIDVFKEQITNGETGLLFELMNANDMAAKMEYAMDHYEECVQMGEAARKYAIDHFDIEKVAVRYEEYYKQLLKSLSPVRTANKTVMA